MMLSLSVAGLKVQVEIRRQHTERREPVFPRRDFRAESHQQALHLLYGASAPPR